MSSVDVGTAFVRILPDTTQFNAALAAQMSAATGVGGANTKVAASATAAASQTRALAGAQTASAASAARVASAELAVTRATIAATAATEALNAAIAKNAAATEIQTLTQKAAVASQALNVAQLRQAAVLQGASGVGGLAKAEKGLVSVGTEANVARGALIGLSRITPVAVFGLGVWGTAAIAAGLAIKSAVSSAADFESQMLTFKAVTQSTDEQMKLVSETALALGADLSLPATSANDASTALLELSKAGLSVADSLAAAKGVLQLATVANLSAGEAAQITAGQLNAFKLSGDQATRVAELLADASIAAQGEISDFAAAFQQAGTAANQSGVSIEDTTALLTELGRAGIRGADAGTSLRTFLLRLVPTTKEASQYVKALGIELDKNKTIGAQLPSVIEQYRTQLEKLNPQTQTLVLNQIFGQDAFRASSIIFTQQKDALKGLTDEFAKTNAIEDLSAAKADGLKGAVGSLTSTLQTMGTEFGLIVTGPLESFVRGINESLISVGNMVEALNAIDVLPEQFDKTVNVIFKTDLGPFPNLATVLGVLALGPVALPAVITKKFLDQFKDTTPKPAVSAPAGLSGPLSPTRGVDEDTQAAAKAQAAATKVDPALQARINALKAPDALARARAGVLIPKALQQAQVDAQIANSLKAELDADNAILKYLTEKRNRLKEGTAKYLAASQQIEAAQSARDAVQAEIDGISDKKKADREAARNERVRTAEEEARKDQAAQDLIRRTIIDIDQQTYSNLIAAARLTPSNADDIRRRENRIKQITRRRDEAVAIKNAAAKGSQAQLDAILQVKKLNGEILGLQSEIAGLGKGGASGGGGGFSLQDLFKESLRQFQEFGSNVSSNPLSPGQVRGQFGGLVARAIISNPKNQKDLSLVGIDKNTGDAAEYMRKLYEYFTGQQAPSGKGTAVTPISVGRRTADIGRLLHRNVGHL